ncbi:MAG TPA: hypothetical protein VNU71_11095 [Burkholderiaceae bacterium]|nr:hypothetical protein [Burkholderiaceae bacterium]
MSSSSYGWGRSVAFVGALMAQSVLAQAGPPPFDVKVINAPANAVPVTVVNTPVAQAVQPFQQRLFFASGPPAPESQFTVPAGKRLLIETVTVEVQTPPTLVGEASFSTSVGGVVAIHRLKLGQDGLNFFSRMQYSGTHNVRIYADPGTVVQFTARPLTTGSALGDFSVSGQLFNVP